MTHIAVIGSNGYIARNLIQVMQQRSNLSISMYGHQAQQIDQQRPYQQIDIFSRSDLENIITNCDILYFFTGKTGTFNGFSDINSFLDLNIKSLLYLLDLCKDMNPSVKIVFPSTRLVYQGSENPLNEDAPKSFLTPYAIQKYSCEQYLSMYHNLFDTQYVVARICIPYGSLVSPITSYGTVNFFIDQAKEHQKITLYGDGKQKRTFTYIEDLCNILLDLGLNSQTANDVYNVGGESITLEEVATKIASKMDSQVVHIPWPDTALKIESGSTAFDSNKLDAIFKTSYSMTLDRWIQNL